MKGRNIRIHFDIFFDQGGDCYLLDEGIYKRWLYFFRLFTVYKFFFLQFIDLKVFFPFFFTVYQCF
jgi:hypothetical protein